MNRVVALYIRLSTEDYKVESMSIDNQKLALHKYTENLDDLTDYEIREFVDNGYSGTNFERPAVQELLDLARDGKIDCIIVKDFSRFGRNSLEVGYFMEKVFPLYGVRFISINDDFDSGKLHADTGGLNMAFKYLVSELYSRDLSIKYKSAKYVKFKKGEYQSKICPYGYQKSADGRMEPDQETAPIVRMIFEMAAQGQNTTAIIKALFDRNVPTPGEYKKAKGQDYHDVSRCGGIWQRSTLARLLRDERYTGTYIIGKRRRVEVGSNHVRMKDESEWVKIPNHHPAIVTKELFDKTQKAMRREKCPKKQIHLYPLRDKVYCGNCLHRLARIGNVTFRFVCRHTVADEKAPCHELKVEESELETVVYSVLKKQAQIILGAADGDADGLEALSAKQAGYGQQISKIQEQKRVLFEQIVLHELSEQEYRMKKGVLDAELTRLQEVKAVLSTQLSQRQADEQTKNANRLLAEKVVDIGKLNTELVDMLIDRVYVYPQQNIEIVWKAGGFGFGGKEIQKNF